MHIASRNFVTFDAVLEMVLASVTTFVLKASIVSRNFVTFDAVLEMVLASVTPIHLTIY